MPGFLGLAAAQMGPNQRADSPQAATLGDAVLVGAEPPA